MGFYTITIAEVIRPPLLKFAVLILAVRRTGVRRSYIICDAESSVHYFQRASM